MQSTNTYLLPCAYFGPIEYFAYLNQLECQIEVNDYFVKQSLRNRCKIFGANGTLTLTVPKKRKNSSKTLFKDIIISYDWNWQKEHWQSITSAYRSSPYFEFYESELYKIIHSKHHFLLDLNLEINHFLCSKIGLPSFPKLTKKYENGVDYVDLRNYTFEHAITQPYFQVFDNKYGFLPKLSILDLFLNEGRNTKSYLDKLQINP